jgi:hypothetical protein
MEPAEDRPEDAAGQMTPANQPVAAAIKSASSRPDESPRNCGPGFVLYVVVKMLRQHVSCARALSWVWLTPLALVSGTAAVRVCLVRRSRIRSG